MARRKNNELANRLQASINTLGTAAIGKSLREKALSQTPQAPEIPRKVPQLNGMTGSKSYVDTDRARRNYAQQQTTSNDENYVVNRERYNKLMQNSRLANDIKTLAEVNYKNANQDASVSQEWANEFGAKAITGGLNKDQFLLQLSKRYELTPEELNDMALTFHSDAYKKETEQYGQGLEKIGRDNALLGSAGSLIGTLGSGIEGMYNTGVGLLGGDDRYLSNIFSTTKKSPREGAKQTMKTDVGKGAYDLLMGVGDMFATAAAGSAPVLLAGNTANESQQSAMERGSSVRKASGYAAASGALDFITNKIGLDKAKNLAVSSIKSSGIKGFLAKNAMAGLGEAGENVLQDIGQYYLDDLINGKNSELRQSFENKVANGMDTTDAFKETAKEYALQLAKSGALGFAMGSTMQAGHTVLPKVPEYITNKWAEGQMLNITDPTIRDIVAGAMEGATKKVPALEGEELAAAKKKVADNKIMVNTLKAKKDAIINDKASWHNKKLTKAAEAQIKEIDSQISSIQNDSKLTRRQIKGTPTPVKEMLSPEDYDAIYSGRTGIAADLDYAVRFAGNTDEAKAIRLEAKKQLNNYIKSGDIADLRAFLGKVTELDKLARTTNAVYQSQKGKTTYAEHFGVDETDPDFPMVLSSVLNTRGLMEGVPAAHERYKAQFATEPVAEAPTPEPTAESAPETPRNTLEFEDKEFGERVANVTNPDNSFANMNALFEQVAKKNAESAPVEAPAKVPEVTRPNEPISETQIHGEDGRLLDNAAIPEYTAGEDVYFRGSDADIAQAEAQDKAIVDTFRNIITDPEFNALSFKNGNKEVFVSPATNGNGLRMSYTIDGVPTGHHDYSLDQIDELSAALRNEVGNGGEDIKIQRKSDLTEGSVKPQNDVPHMEGTMPGDNVVVPPSEPPITSEPPRTENRGQSDVGLNTAVNSGVYTKEQLENDPILREMNSYAKASNDLTYGQAQEDVIKDGATLLDEYSTGKRAITNDLDVDRSMILLTDLARRIEGGETGLEAQRNLLFSRLRQAGTKYGQTIQAFAKWNQTPEGAIINAERIHKKPVEKWKENNQTKVNANSRIAKALERMGYDGSMDKVKNPPSRDTVREGVIKAIEQEYGSIEGIFNDEDIEFLTDLAMNRKIPIWQITDEIEHRLNHGMWYEITEETPEPPKKGNQKLQKALNDLLEREPVEKEPLTFDELKEQIRNTLDKEYASAGTSRLYTDQGEFTDADVDYLAHMIQNGATGAELSEALDTKLATGTFGISAETQAKVNKLFEYANQFDPNSKEACEAQAAAYKLLADEVVGKATPFEKFEAWRYLAMLGNPKTMLRNYIGNNIFGAVTGVSNNLSALLEAGTDKLVRQITNGQKSLTRTKAVLNPVKDKGLIDASANDLDKHRYKQAQGRKYEKGVKDAITSAKSVFNSRWAQIYENLTDRGISDYGAVKRKYSTSLAGWMKANGLDESAFDAEAYYQNLLKESRFRVLSDAERAQMENYKQIADKLEKGRDYAMGQAEYATFHEDNVVAQMITRWSADARGSKSPFAKMFGYAIEGLVPFKKTPANVLRSGVEYSPLNVINSIRETGKFIIENTGHRKNDLADTYTKTNKLTGREKTLNRSLAADVIDSWSKTLTGTAMAGLGYYLADKGILHLSEDGEKYQDQLEGKQNYSIIINGHSYTIDWSSPAAMPLLMGAELNELWTKLNQPSEKFFDNFDDILGAVSALLDPVFETSMLQGVQNTAESVAHEITYGNSGLSKGMAIGGAILGNTLGNYVTQVIPTLSGQIARTVDPIRRTSDTANEGFFGSLERAGRKQMNKIPGLSMLNTPYYDTYARQQKNSPFDNPLGNLAYQMLSPGYYDKVEETPADKSARSVYNRRDEHFRPVKNEKVLPELKSVVRINGEKLNPEDKAKYNVKAGTAQKMIRNALANQKWFKELPGTEQEEILSKVNSIADKVGKEQFAEQTGTEYEKYKEGGLPGLLEYFRGQSVKSKVEQQTGLKSTTNASKAIVEQVEQGNQEVADQMMDDATVIQKAFSNPHVVDDYYTAQKALPQLNADRFISTFKEMDADNSQAIALKELEGYINSHFSKKQNDKAQSYWKAFYGGWKNKEGKQRKLTWDENAGKYVSGY